MGAGCRGFVALELCLIPVHGLAPFGLAPFGLCAQHPRNGHGASQGCGPWTMDNLPVFYTKVALY
jgi:hypothetical protein